MKKRAIGIVAVVLILSLAFSVSAAAGLTRASLYLSSYSAGVSATGGGNVRVSFDVYAVSLADKVGASLVVIQRKNGSSWVAAQTFTGSTSNGMLASNSLFNSDDITYSGTPGNEYRAVVTAYAKIGSGSDAKTITTSSVVA